MKAGITATREGMTDKQKEALRCFLRGDHPSEFHHGGCKGGDTEASWIAHEEGIKVICHPPINKKHIGNYYADEVCEPKPYLDRNHDIVDEVDRMYAFPKETKMQWRGSGTWATIRYASKKNKETLISYP